MESLPPGKLSALDAQTGLEIDLRDQWIDRRCIVVFIRHFLWYFTECFLNLVVVRVRF